MTTPPEADLEAHLSAQLLKIFPHIPPGDIDHQTHLVLRFGRNEITVNGETKWKKKGRADIVLNHKGKPIAVIELKRAGVKLTRDDVDQGRNYARVLEHPAPLVVVTNGSDTATPVARTWSCRRFPSSSWPNCATWFQGNSRRG